MDTINQAVAMIINEFKKECDNENIEECELVGVFNDGVILIYKEDDTLKIKVVAGEPFKFDYNLNLLESN